MSSSDNRALFCLVPLAGGADEVLFFKENRPYRQGPARRFLDLPYFVVGPSRPSKQPGALVSLGSSKEDSDIWLGSDSGNYKGFRKRHCVFFISQSGELCVRPFTGARVCVALCDTEQEGDDSDYEEESRPRRVYEQRPLEGQPIRAITIPRDPKWEITVAFGEHTCFRLVWLEASNSPCWSLVDSGCAKPRQAVAQGARQLQAAPQSNSNKPPQQQQRAAPQSQQQQQPLQQPKQPANTQQRPEQQKQVANTPQRRMPQTNGVGSQGKAQRPSS